jgi:hypothetical protein
MSANAFTRPAIRNIGARIMKKILAAGLFVIVLSPVCGAFNSPIPAKAFE